MNASFGQRCEDGAALLIKRAQRLMPAISLPAMVVGTKQLKTVTLR